VPEQLIHYPRHNWGTVQTPGTVVVGIALRGQRESCDVRLRRLATKLGFLPQELSNWETGKRKAPVMSVARILSALDVDPDTTEYVLTRPFTPTPRISSTRVIKATQPSPGTTNTSPPTPSNGRPRPFPTCCAPPSTNVICSTTPSPMQTARTFSLGMPRRRDDLADRGRHYTFLLGDPP
jgi:transcriptional regulator with XRE-family HTH domain